MTKIRYHSNEQELDELKDRIVNVSLIVFCVLISVIDVMVYFRNMELGLTLPYLVQLSLTFLLLFITVVRKRLSLTFKVYFLIFLVSVGIVSGIWSRGFLTSTKIYAVAAPVFLSFLISYRKSLVSLGIFLIIYMAGAFLFINGILDYRFDTNDYINSPATWAVDFVIIGMSSWALIFLANSFRKTLDLNYLQLQRQNVDLINNQTKYQQLFESANDAITLLEDGTFTDCNRKACEYFQLKKEELIGLHPWDVSPEFQPDGTPSKQKANELISHALGGDSSPFEWQHKRSNGEVFDVSITLNVVTLNDRSYVQGILRDITVRKKQEKELANYRNKLEQLIQKKTKDLEATNKELRSTNKELENTLKNLQEAQSQLVQAEKMASLGVMTAGVAHEINNPLNYIMGGYTGLIDLLEDSEIKSDDLDMLLSSIKTGVDRASTIVKGLNQFSRDRDTFDEKCMLHEIIDNCLIMLHNKYRKNIEIIKKYENSEPTIKGNVGKLHQTFLNILSNSIQAIKDAGKITITTKTTDDHIQVRIADTGSGIPKKYLNKIGDPFFTTKDPGEGTGLGLSIAFSIIKDHNGTITYSSEVGEGTTVLIEFPI
jgi:PAS domain S-box-containing protein